MRIYRARLRARAMTQRSFGGTIVAEVAAAPGVSVTTVEQERRLARAWLAGRLGGRER
jgi:DNA-directed RNA polymerase specialized sigma24 family protein